MGAQLSLMAPTAPSIAVSAYVDVLDEIQYKRPIGSSRFLRTVKAQDPDGAIVVKVFIKPSQDIPLENWKKVLQVYKHRLSDVPSALSYTKIIETDRAGYLIRQFIKTNAYDRISTRPFLEDVEKKWIAFQLLNTLSECHERGVVHGDIKTENVLVTSWNWVLLSDFAPFKPIYLPEDNPGSFSFYFDTSQRRTCYLAPERFVSQGDDTPAESDTVTHEMDVFSMGCVIAEIFLEGAPIFTLSQLYKYRKGEFMPDLSGIGDEELRNLITSMIQLDPTKRSSAKEYLDKHKGTLFPLNFYNFLYEYFKSFNEEIPYNSVGNVYECDSRIHRLYSDYDKIAYFLGYTYAASTHDEEDELKIQRGELTPIRLSLPGVSKTYNMVSTSKIKETDDNALVLLSFIFTALRNVRQEESKIQALELILALSERTHDEGKLDRCLPYIISLLDDTSINVQSKALKTMTQILLLVDSIGPVNVALFTDYIIPRLSKLVSSSNPYVRMTFATCLPYLAQTSLRFYYMGTILRDNVVETFIDPETENGGLGHSGFFDVSRETLSADFETFAISMLTDMDVSVKIALLRNILPLCAFFGKEKTNDLILSHLITYLNDKSSQLRVAFVEAVVGLSIYVGTISLEHYILPLLVQTLSDPEELVVIKVLHIFEDLARLGLIRRDFIWDLLNTVSKLLLHPNDWIRQSVLSLIVTFSESLSLADLYCMLYPIIRPYIEYDVTDFTWETLYSVCKKPLSRPVYNLASTWSLRAGKTLFWKQVKNTLMDAFGNRGLDFMSHPVSNLNGSKIQSSDSIIFGNLEIPLSSEDKSWVDRLKSSGLNEPELWKIADLREYIFRVSRMNARTATNDIEQQGFHIQELGVLPRNIFFDVKVHSEPFTQTHIEDVSGSTDDRLMGVDSFGVHEVESSDTVDDRTVSITPVPVQDDMARSLILGRPKAVPSIMAQEQNAYGELESSFHQHRRSSTQAQRLKTTNILTSVVTNSYAGMDPYVIRFLNTVKLEPSLEEFSEFTQVEKMPVFDTTKSWNPTGDLVAYLKEHTSSITTVDVSSDHSYFITGDDSGILKLWDTSKLERNVSHSSVLSVELDNPITKLKMLPKFHCFAVATKDGSLRVMSINFNKSKKSALVESVTIIREMKLDDDQYALDINVGSRQQNHMLYVVSSLSQIISIDMRNMDVNSKLQNNPLYGIITTFTMPQDDSWVLVGTSKGVISLWDLRFQVHLKSWKFKNSSPITKMSMCASEYHLNRKKGRFVTVIGGSGDADAGIFDVTTGIFREIFTRTTNGSTLERLTLVDVEDTLDDDVRKALENLSVSEAEDNSMTSCVSFENQSRKIFYVLIASRAFEILLWDVNNAMDSKLVVGNREVKNENGFVVSQMNSSTKIISERLESDVEQKIKKERTKSLMSGAQERLIRHHHSRITSMAVILKPYPMVVSVDRSGTINVYR